MDELYITQAQYAIDKVDKVIDAYRMHTWSEDYEKFRDRKSVPSMTEMYALKDTGILFK